MRFTCYCFITTATMLERLFMSKLTELTTTNVGEKEGKIYLPW